MNLSNRTQTAKANPYSYTQHIHNKRPTLKILDGNSKYEKQCQKHKQTKMQYKAQSKLKLKSKSLPILKNIKNIVNNNKNIVGKQKCYLLNVKNKIEKCEAYKQEECLQINDIPYEQLQAKKNSLYSFKMKLLFCNRTLKLHPSNLQINRSQNRFRTIHTISNQPSHETSHHQSMHNTHSQSHIGINIGRNQIKALNSRGVIGGGSIDTSTAIVQSNSNKSTIENITFQPLKSKKKFQEQSRQKKAHLSSIAKLEDYVMGYLAVLKMRKFKMENYPCFDTWIKMISSVAHTAKIQDNYHKRIKQKNEIQPQFQLRQSLPRRERRSSLPSSSTSYFMQPTLTTSTILTPSSHSPPPTYPFWYIGTFIYRILHHKMLNTNLYLLWLQNIANNNVFIIEVDLGNKIQQMFNKVKFQQQYRYQWFIVQYISRVFQVKMESCFKRRYEVVTHVVNGQVNLLEIRKCVIQGNMQQIKRENNAQNMGITLLYQTANLIPSNRTRTIKQATTQYITHYHPYQPIPSHPYQPIPSHPYQPIPSHPYQPIAIPLSLTCHKRQQSKQFSKKQQTKLRHYDRYRGLRYMMHIVELMKNHVKQGNDEYFSKEEEMQIKEQQRLCHQIFLIKVGAQNVQDVNRSMGKYTGVLVDLEQELCQQKIKKILSTFSHAQFIRQKQKKPKKYVNAQPHPDPHAHPPLHRHSHRPVAHKHTHIHNNIILVNFLFKGTFKNMDNYFQQLPYNSPLRSRSPTKKQLYAVNIYTLTYRYCNRSQKNASIHKYIVVKSQKYLQARNNFNVAIALTVDVNKGSKAGKGEIGGKYGLENYLQKRFNSSQICCIQELKSQILAIVRASSAKYYDNKHKGCDQDNQLQDMHRSDIKLSLMDRNSILVNQSILRPQPHPTNIFHYTLIIKSHIHPDHNSIQVLTKSPLYYKINLHIYPGSNVVFIDAQCSRKHIKVKVRGDNDQHENVCVGVDRKMFGVQAYFWDFADIYEDVVKEVHAHHHYLPYAIITDANNQTYASVHTGNRQKLQKHRSSHMKMLQNLKSIWILKSRSGHSYYNQISLIKRKIKYRLTKQVSITTSIHQSQHTSSFQSQTYLKILPFDSQKQSHRMHRLQRAQKAGRINNDKKSQMLLFQIIKLFTSMPENVISVVRLRPCLGTWFHFEEGKCFDYVVCQPMFEGSNEGQRQGKKVKVEGIGKGKGEDKGEDKEKMKYILFSMNYDECNKDVYHSHLVYTKHLSISIPKLQTHAAPPLSNHMKQLSLVLHRYRQLYSQCIISTNPKCPYNRYIIKLNMEYVIQKNKASINTHTHTHSRTRINDHQQKQSKQLDDRNEVYQNCVMVYKRGDTGREEGIVCLDVIQAYMSSFKIKIRNGVNGGMASDKQQLSNKNSCYWRMKRRLINILRTKTQILQ